MRIAEHESHALTGARGGGGKGRPPVPNRRCVRDPSPFVIVLRTEVCFAKERDSCSLWPLGRSARLDSVCYFVVLELFVVFCNYGPPARLVVGGAVVVFRMPVFGACARARAERRGATRERGGGRGGEGERGNMLGRHVLPARARASVLRCAVRCGGPVKTRQTKSSRSIKKTNLEI